MSVSKSKMAVKPISSKKIINISNAKAYAYTNTIYQITDFFVVCDFIEILVNKQ